MLCKYADRVRYGIVVVNQAIGLVCAQCAGVVHIERIAVRIRTHQLVHANRAVSAGHIGQNQRRSQFLFQLHRKKTHQIIAVAAGAGSDNNIHGLFRPCGCFFIRCGRLFGLRFFGNGGLGFRIFGSSRRRGALLRGGAASKHCCQQQNAQDKAKYFFHVNSPFLFVILNFSNVQDQHCNGNDDEHNCDGV